MSKKPNCLIIRPDIEAVFDAVPRGRSRGPEHTPEQIALILKYKPLLSLENFSKAWFKAYGTRASESSIRRWYKMYKQQESGGVM